MNNKKRTSVTYLIPQETVESKIFFLRNEKMMLDNDLALLYNVETKQLKRAVNRNLERFPDDFMFKLTMKEYKVLRCQTGTLKRGRHAKYLPYAFSEQGIAMLSSVLNSKRAILVNIQIIRIFTKLRKLLISHEDLKRKIISMEEKYDGQFKIVFDAIRQLLTPPEKPRRRIGFHPHED